MRVSSPISYIAWSRDSDSTPPLSLARRRRHNVAGNTQLPQSIQPHSALPSSQCTHRYLDAVHLADTTAHSLGADSCDVVSAKGRAHASAGKANLPREQGRKRHKKRRDTEVGAPHRMCFVGLRRGASSREGCNAEVAALERS